MLEVEVKFFLLENQSERIKMALERMGARSEGRVFERNLRLDDADERLRKKNCLLRLRQDRRGRLTWKSPPESTASSASSLPEGGDIDPGQYKVYQELETEVGDIRIMEQILIFLGFAPVQIYEKYRETFHMDGVEACLDEMPFGVFLELEGEPEHIRKTAENLGLAWEERILDNYLSLFSRLRKEMNLAFTDVTFDAFSRVQVSLQEIARVMAASRSSSKPAS